MKKYIKLIFISIAVCMLSIVTSCSGGKNPYSGYVSLEEVEEQVINKISSKEYTQYTLTSEFNFRSKEVLGFPEAVNKNFYFTPAPDEFSDECTSHYLLAPLQITSKNWVILNEDGSVNAVKSTREKIISKMYKVNDAYNDTYYMYLEEDGGFSIRSFGVNKKITLYEKKSNGSKKKRLETKGKFDITLKYDKNGYLVYEAFQTINTHNGDKKDTCYAYATYTYR